MATSAAVRLTRRARLRIATPGIIGAIVAGVCSLLYHELAEQLTLSPAVVDFDRVVSSSVQSWRSPALTLLFRGATLSADTLTMTTLILAVVAVLVWTCNHREALVVALVMATGTGLGNIGKRITARPRPRASSAIIELPPSFAFPSGHSLAAILFWTLLVFVVMRVAKATWARALVVVGGMLMTLLVGMSRVYLGVHWPSDVLASWILGAGWLAFTLGIFLSWERAVGPAED